MALWMEEGTPLTEKEQADLDAINAIRESSAVELKEKGNQYIKMGKKHYTDAIDCYSRAINQKISNDIENSIFFANRAHANLLLGNYRRALMDAEDAVKINPKNVKAYYRGAKAALGLELLEEAGRFCRTGLEHFMCNDELKKLGEQVNAKQAEIDNRKLQASEALSIAEALTPALESRGLKLGKVMYKELTGVRKPRLDESGILHWPVLFLYGEVMSSDFVEDFLRLTHSHHILICLFGKDAPQLPWDEHHAYSREVIELYYQDTAGTIATNFEQADDGDLDDDFASMSVKDASKWVKVNESKTLQDVLKQQEHVIPGIPVFMWCHVSQAFMKNLSRGVGLFHSCVPHFLSS